VEEPLVLTNSLLVAMPHMSESLFDRTVIYICNHSADGAMGLVINHFLDHIPLLHISKKIMLLSGEDTPNHKIPVYFGGPVESSRSFILHSNDYKIESTLELSPFLCLTTPSEALGDLMRNDGPKHYLFALGYTSWGPGQLEEELIQNQWLTLAAKTDIIFDVPAKDKWNHCFSNLGISLYKLSAHFGRA
jgi:putative transcriptional regulator